MERTLQHHALCNTVIERVDRLQYIPDEIKTRGALHGVDLPPLRCYLQLLQVYAALSNQNSGAPGWYGIIMRDRVAFELLPRSSVRQSLQSIENRINKAQALLEDNTIKIEGSNAINWLGWRREALLLLAQTALWSGN